MEREQAGGVPPGLLEAKGQSPCRMPHKELTGGLGFSRLPGVQHLA